LIYVYKRFDIKKMTPNYNPITLKVLCITAFKKINPSNKYHLYKICDIKKWAPSCNPIISKVLCTTALKLKPI